MSKQKKDNAMQLDPDRFKVAQSMSTVPGGPMNNYPVAQGDFVQKSSLSGVNTFPYGDSGLQVMSVWVEYSQRFHLKCHSR